MNHFFINNFNELVRLVAAGGLLCLSFPKRKKFPARLLVALLLGLAAAMVMSWGMRAAARDGLVYEIAAVRGNYCLMLAMVTLMVCGCFQVNLWMGLAVSLCAYCMENMVSNLQNFVNQSPVALNSTMVIWVLTAVVYGITFLWVKGKMKGSLFNPNKAVLLLNLFCVLMICIFLPTTFYTYGQQVADREFYNMALQIISFISLIFDAMTVVVEVTMVEKNRIKHESEQLNRLLDMNREQYERSKETINVINRKYHDLKYYLDAQKKVGTLDKSTTREIEDVIGFYDLHYQTGNHALDTVLTEYAMRCKNNEVTFSCIADGSLMGFMKSTDIYVMFGNALDNAMEHVKQYDPQRRIIAVYVTAAAGLTMIHIENYCEQEPLMQDGRYVTSKPDKDNHGFGTESIRYIASQYGGSCSMKYENQMFQLDLTFCQE